MPAAYIHENIAKKALSMTENVPAYIKENMDAFELGAQGPDFLFYYNILKFWDKDISPIKLGNEMHNRKINDFFNVMLPAAKEKGGAAAAWACGFVTHYAADTTIHPFVYARTDNPDGSRNLTAHLLIESQFDTWYYWERQNRKGIPRQALCAKRMTTEQRAAVAEVLEIACAKVYPESGLTREQAHKATRDMNIVIAMLYSPHKIKHAIYRLIEKIIKKPDIVIRHSVAHKLPEYDFLNLEKNTWENPWDRTLKSDKSFPELFDMASNKAAAYIGTVLSYFKDKTLLEETAGTMGNNSYASGLPVQAK